MSSSNRSEVDDVATDETSFADGAATRLTIIGDVHGRLNSFERIVETSEPEHLIQIGDFGMRDEHLRFLERYDPMRYRILFGNHDYIPFLGKPHSLGDWARPYPGIMTIRGAASVDRRYRTTGISWWPNEQISPGRVEECRAAYEADPPSVVISHDAPDSIRRSSLRIHERSRTSDLLQSCFETAPPDIWIFGHHHTPLRRTMFGTEFIGLDLLEVLELMYQDGSWMIA